MSFKYYIYNYQTGFKLNFPFRQQLQYPPQRPAQDALTTKKG